MNSNIEKKNVDKSDKTKIFTKEFMKPASEIQKRTTILLTEQGSESLDWIRTNSKRKINSIIDKLCELISKNADDKHRIWEDIIIESAKDQKDNKYLKRKSIVLSQKSLKILNDIAKKSKIPRDSIINSYLLILTNILKHSDEERRKNHEKAFTKIEELYSTMAKVEKELNELLDEDDPIIEDFRIAMVHIMNLSQALKDEL